MNFLKTLILRGFQVSERGCDRLFGPDWNPLYNLGTLGFFFYWIVAVTGIYIYIFFDTGITEAYASIDYMTHEQWYLAGVMRSLHRYASDGMVLVMLMHMTREFALDRYRGSRWFSWFTGVPSIWLLIVSGITGYWLVWDQLAQYIAIATTEWLDWLPIFGGAIARNFISASSLDDRFFTLMIFLHVAVPLILLLVMWIHLNRVSRARVNPSRGLAIGSFGMLLGLAIVYPAESQAPADLATVPAVVGLDWFFTGFYPLMEIMSNGAVWGMAVALTIILAAMPWLPPYRQAAAARVDLSNCNGCSRCAADCPYSAIDMKPRSDGLPFEHEAVVDPDLCVRCGICAGACPTGTPFRRATALSPGIDMPDLPLSLVRDRTEAACRSLSGPGRVMVYACDHAARLGRTTVENAAVVNLPCIAMLPPSFIDFVLSQDHADGVFLLGCREGGCRNRFGVEWMEARIAGTRDPHLRKRVPRDRLASYWAAPPDRRAAEHALVGFQASLRKIATAPTKESVAPEGPPRSPVHGRPTEVSPGE